MGHSESADQPRQGPLETYMGFLVGGLGIGNVPVVSTQPVLHDEEALYREAADIFSHPSISERRRIALAMSAAHIVADPGVQRIELRDRIGETTPVFAYVLGVLTMRPVYTFPLPPPIMQKPFVHIQPERPLASSASANECYKPADSLLWLASQPPDICPPLHAALEQLHANGSL